MDRGTLLAGRSRVGVGAWAGPPAGRDIPGWTSGDRQAVVDFERGADPSSASLPPWSACRLPRRLAVDNEQGERERRTAGEVLNCSNPAALSNGLLLVRRGSMDARRGFSRLSGGLRSPSGDNGGGRFHRIEVPHARHAAGSRVGCCALHRRSSPAVGGTGAAPWSTPRTRLIRTNPTAPARYPCAEGCSRWFFVFSRWY